MGKPKKGRKKRKGRSSLFPSRTYATRIAEAIKRDLSGLVGRSDSVDMFVHSTNAEILKKFSAPGSDYSKLEGLTYQKFLKVNEHMRSFRDIKTPDLKRIQTPTPREDRILLRARALVHQVLHSFDLEEIFSHCNNSSGSSIGVPFEDTSPEKKFTFPISVTDDALPLLEAYYRWDKLFQRAVQDWNRANPVTGWYTVEKGSRATTVDKTDLIRRMIAIEATGNMFLQQGIMATLYERMKEVGLNVRTLPERNRMMARLSSLTGALATIDWTSASDCVSVGLVRWLVPPDWFRVMDITRSKSMKVDKQWVDLHMFSTMGNAVTFPLETLTFWALAHAVVFTDEHPRSNSSLVSYEQRERISVFGDDCVVPTQHAPAFIAACESYGFLVNEDKSFYGTERFRESCGGDYLHGNLVRALHVRAPTSERISALEPWLYTIANKVVEKYILYFGSLTYVYDKSFFKLLSQLFRKHKLQLKLVPPDFPEDSGLRLSEDWHRFAASYDFRFSPLEVFESEDYQSSVTKFRFCRYRLKDKRERSDALRLALALKFPRKAYAGPGERNDWHAPLHPDREPEDIYRTKRVGGYVVASSTTLRWSVEPGCLPG